MESTPVRTAELFLELVGVVVRLSERVERLESCVGRLDWPLREVAVEPKNESCYRASAARSIADGLR